MTGASAPRSAPKKSPSTDVPLFQQPARLESAEKLLFRLGALEPASIEMVENVLSARFPDLSEVDTRRIAEFAGGNFRVALALAGTVAQGESVSSLQDAELFERLFRQNNEPDPSLLRAGEACSLLYSFDGESAGENSELMRLGGLVEQTPNQLYGKVRELQRRDLVQARSVWRAVLPHAIANRLARLALQNIPVSQIETQLITTAPERVKRSFSRRLGYLHDSGEARSIVERWLQPGGVLSSIAILDELHTDMLMNIAPVSPAAVVGALEKELNGPHKQDLFKKRDSLVRLIRSLAFDAELFERCAKLLVAFAAEDADEDKSDAADALTSLFYLYLSGTHASLDQRVQVMEALVRSSNPNEQRLGLRAFRALLEASHFSSGYNFEFGARSRDFGYRPGYSEAQAWFARVLGWGESIAAAGIPVSESVASAIASAFRGLWTNAHMYDDLERVSRSLAGRSYWRDGWIAISQTLAYDKAEQDSAEHLRLMELEKQLRPANLVQKVRSIVFSSDSKTFSLDDYEEPEGEEPETAWARTEALVERLGGETIHDSEALTTVLPEALAGSGSGRVFAFGRGLGKGSAEPAKHWDVLKNALTEVPEERRDIRVLSGFLQAVGEDRPDILAGLLDEAIADPLLAPHFPFLQCSVSVGEAGCRRLLQSLKLGIAPIHSYQRLAWARAHESVTGAALAALMAEIAGKPGGVCPGLEIAYFRLISDRHTNEPEIIAICRDLLVKLEFSETGPRDDHRLSLLVEKCLKGDGDAVAKTVCERFRASALAAPHKMSDYDDFFGGLCKAQPRIVLDTFFVGTDAELRAVNQTLRWFRTKRQSLRMIPTDAWLEWCSEEPQTRYATAARFVPFTNDVEQDDEEESKTSAWSDLALKLIDLAPDPVSVIREFTERFWPSSWSGSLASILESRMALLNDLLQHPNSSVADFAAERITQLRAEIEEERTRETARERGRDERFE